MSEALAAPAPAISTGSRIVRGTVSAFALNVLAYGCLFIGQVLIARLLSRGEYAQFTVSISFVAILALVADLGMNPLFARLFAEAEEHVAQGCDDRRGILLGSALALRVFLSLVVVALFAIFAPMFYSASMVSIMSILLLTLVISSRMLIVRSVGEAILRGRGKYYVVASFALFDAIAFAVLMILASYRHVHLEDVLWIYTLSNVPGFLFLALSIAKWVRRERIRVQVHWSMMRELLQASLPLALGTAFLTIHTQIDNLLLDKLSTPFEVSSFGATMRLSAAMAPFSLVLAAVTAPELTRLLGRNDVARARQLTGISLRLLLIIGAGIALVVTALSNEIVPLILTGKYASASPLLIWTGWMIIPIFISTLLMEVSIAAEHSWFMTTNTAICMVAVIIGDVLLIPVHGAAGAMTSKLIAVTLGAATMIWLSRNTGHLDARGFGAAFLKTAGAALVALGLFWLVESMWQMELIPAALMLMCYVAAIHFTHVLPFSEARALIKRLRNPPSFSAA